MKEVIDSASSSKEAERRRYLKQQLTIIREQLRAANNKLQELATMVETVPRQTHTEYISVPAHGNKLLRASLYGGDEFKYNIYCQGLYLQTGFGEYYLNPRFNSLIIAGRKGIPMRAKLLNRSNSPCDMKGNVYSIPRLRPE
ncbi:hypothetical protein EXU57_24745 [Segetibacter sp. 3557_3]|uniref:hypothetical protein n=1 Tax=Segetibacter sp. 3557_3 TaxID=2547429 RepID=UPI001058E27A|nr:hypothetical protein [Segetibacter sp. 3557_3]TDH17802.1 hypothetical protein EXU57_24745 [Segetibacter sp. 3557_3]